MKSTITSKLFGAVIAIAVVAIASSAQAMQQGSAKVIKLVGAARYSTGNNVWLPISEGTMLRPGSVIQTASESSVDVLLSGEDTGASGIANMSKTRSYGGSAGEAAANVIRLRENTLLAIDRLTWEQTGADTVTDTQLDLRAGTVFGSVKKASAASRYEVKVPNGVAGIRGTLYSFSTSGILTVFVGSVVITYLNPNDTSETITRVVGAGQQYDMNTDKYTPVPVSQQTDAKHLASDITVLPGVTIVPVTYSKDPTPIISPVVPDIEGHQEQPD